jgi:hypothetical protein
VDRKKRVAKFAVLWEESQIVAYVGFWVWLDINFLSTANCNVPMYNMSTEFTKSTLR